jgi:hypothetical protein
MTVTDQFPDAPGGARNRDSNGRDAAIRDRQIQNACSLRGRPATCEHLQCTVVRGAGQLRSRLQNARGGVSRMAPSFGVGRFAGEAAKRFLSCSWWESGRSECSGRRHKPTFRSWTAALHNSWEALIIRGFMRDRGRSARQTLAASPPIR